MLRALALLACTGWLAGGSPAGAIAAPGPGEDEPARERTALLVAFRDGLEALRAGDGAAGPELLRTAEVLDREHGRPDVLAVARFYTALPAADRALGHAAQARYLEQFERVRDARESGEPWPELREDVLAELADIALAAGGDPAPAAYALGLRAELLVHAAEGCTPDEAAEAEALALRALTEAQRASALFERVGMLTPDLEPIWVRARAARLLGRLGEARRAFERCLAIAERVGVRSYQVRALVGLLRIADEVGDVPGHGRLLDELSAVARPADSWELTREYTTFLLHQDHPDVVRRTLERYPPERPADRAEWAHMAGSAALRAGDLAAARAHFEAMREGPKASIARAHLALAEGEPERVIAELAPTLTSQTFGVRDLAEGRSLVGEALLRLGRHEEATGELRAALEITDRWRARNGADTGENAIGERLGVHTVALLAECLSARGRHLEAARTIEEYQSRGLRRRAGTPLSAAQVAAWAAHVELGLVTWAVGADSTVVAHVSPDGTAGSRVLARGRAEVREAVRRLREAVLHGPRAGVDDVRALGEELARALLPDELRERLAGAQRDERLLLLLHGPLEDLPVACLALGDRWLDEVLTPLVLPGLPDAEPGVAPAIRTWTLLGSGEETKDGALPALPGARTEIETLAARYEDARHLVAERAGLAEATAALRGDGGLHAAAHLSRRCGHEAARLAPLGLALAGGEVLCAHLVAAEAPALPLVVLSACESGGGSFVDAEGLLGLARAFLEAGTRDLVVTLWPVEDEAALGFALRFHEALREGAAPSVAVRRARSALRAEGAPAADWAAFRLLGRD